MKRDVPMAYIQSTTQKSALIASALAFFRAIGSGFEQHRALVRTRNELYALSDHGLNDLGLTRADIDRAAMEATIGSAHH